MAVYLDTAGVRKFLDEGATIFEPVTRPDSLDKDALSASIEDVEALKSRIKDKAASVFREDL